MDGGDMYVFLNDRIVEGQQAAISVYDHGFLYGDGIYETMRAYSGVVFQFERHIERLRRSAAFIKLQLPEYRHIRSAVEVTLDANKLSNAYIRITVSRGKGPIGLDPDLCTEPTFVVFAEKFNEYPDQFYKRGVRLIIAKTRRNLKDALDPKIKSLNFLNNILAKMETKEKDAYEAVMLNADGFVAEGTVSNIFFVRDNVLCTASQDVGILDGITRELVVSLAKRNGIMVNEGKFYPEELLQSSEVFFTNTTAEVMPVCRVEDKDFDVGDMTRSLHALYDEAVSDYIRKSKRSP